VSVLDASALVDLVRRGPHAEWVGVHLAGACTLHLADSEAVAALAGLVRAGSLNRSRAAQAVELIEDLPVERFPAHGLLHRTLRLSDGVGAYDAAYLALAEALDEPLVTLDRRLARGAPATIRVITPPARA
jgi:predicted nucleic acid-binding protein